MSFERRLGDMFASAERGMPEASVDWNATVEAAHRGRMLRTGLVAAAVVLVVGGGVWFVSGSLTEDPVRAPDLLPAVSPSAEPSTELPTPDTSPSQPSEEGSDASIVRPRALDWVKAIALGDAETAWSWLAPQSQGYFDNDVSKFEELMPTLQEGWGAWYDGVEDAPQTDTRVMVSGGTEASGVITLYGDITREGSSGFDANALPFRLSDGEVLVDPFSSKIEIVPLQELASRNPRFAHDVLPLTFLAEVPPDVGQVNFFVAGDAGEVVDAALQPKEKEGSQPPNLVARSEYGELLVRGTYALTIAATDATGGIATRTVIFETD